MPMWSFGTTMTMAKDSEPPASPSQEPQLSPPTSKPTTQPTIAPPQPRSPMLSQRSFKQLGLFCAGAGFLALSTLITRRSVVKKQLATIPRFYTPSNRPVNTIGSDSSLIALEALSLATLNVMGFGIMATGGVAWAFDISSIDDLRSMARRQVGPSGGRTDEEAEKEIEEWVAKVLLKKEKKEGKADSPTSKDG